MIIECPFCGKRDAGEFTYRGDGTVVRPALSDSSLEAHQAYVYDRENPAGEHAEIWHHNGGCRSHVRVIRNTVSHKILKCDLVGAFAISPKGGV